MSIHHPNTQPETPSEHETTTRAVSSSPSMRMTYGQSTKDTQTSELQSLATVAVLLQQPAELSLEDIQSAIQSLRTKASKCRQEAAVYDVLVEELEDSIYGS